MKKAGLGWFLCLALWLPISSQAADGWHFKLTPYLWFAGIEGDVSTLPGSPIVPIKLSSSDTLDDTEASFMLLAEAKMNQHGVMADFIYSDVQSKTSIVPAVNLRMKSTSKTTVFSGAYLYELSSGTETSADVFLGLRNWDIESRLQFSGGLGILAGRDVRHSESWVDPFVGIKGLAMLSETSLFASGGLVYGGFGAGSDYFYEVIPAIGYRWNQHIDTTIGYRLWGVKYKEGSFYYDVTQEGWFVSLSGRF